jgi:hypothetical protein
LPADRDEAASLVTVNQGCFASAATNCCPAIPVAPTTAHFLACVLLAMFLLFSVFL